jgi:hypothetical protein
MVTGANGGARIQRREVEESRGEEQRASEKKA